MSGRVALSGASGFIGSHILRYLLATNHSVSALARRPLATCPTVLLDLAEPFSEGKLAEWLQGNEVLIHCAGYAHAFDDGAIEAAQRHRRINRDATLEIARAAAIAGVRRFLFCSSVKAVAEPGERCVDESFLGMPEDSYGLAKREAENGLWEISRETGMEVVVIRPAMVYGPGSRGNLERMLSLVRRGVFPPLPETGNQRSIVFISDLVSAIAMCMEHPYAAGGCYNVAHPQAPSGRQIYVEMCRASGRLPARWSVPASAFKLAARAGDLVGHTLHRQLPFNSLVMSRLLGSACFRSDRLQALGWMPAFDLAKGLGACLQRNDLNT
jgi:UDP-glucose 4-epimerase